MQCAQALFYGLFVPNRSDSHGIPGERCRVVVGAGGTLLLFNKKQTPHFRVDGHNWAKKRNGISIKESHEKLRVNSEFVLSCCYSRAADDNRFRVRPTKEIHIGNPSL